MQFYYHKAFVLKFRSIPEVIDFNETGVSPSGKSLVRRVGQPPIFKVELANYKFIT